MLTIPRLLHLPYLLCCAALICMFSVASAQSVRTDAQALAVAAWFAPVFYQGMGEDPRADLITNFDFDGDWRGDNNWAHAADPRFPLRAYVYYAVSETRTHLFIHYALFHPRDYKGGATRGRILSQIIKEGVKRGRGLDPTGRAAEVTLAHENDMEGCLVVVAKQGADVSRARVVFVETLSHNHFLRYAAEPSEGVTALSFDRQRPLLYIEPKGHGIQAYAEDAKKPAANLLRYAYEGRADTPAANAEAASYELLPIFKTIWPRAQKGVNETFGAQRDYGRVRASIALANGKTQTRTTRLGIVGAAFLGTEGGRNMARPPWGWFDGQERNVPVGTWFFDPAVTIKRHFKLGDEFSVAYTWQPFLGVGPTR